MRTLSLFGLLAVILLAGCSTQLDESMNASSIHGEVMASEAQLPVEDGSYAVSSEEVDYGPASGYLASPNRSQAPGVVLIHEWWGLNDNMRSTADKLASHGYRVLAVDLYGGSVAQNSSQARELVGMVDQEESLANLQAASEYLRSSGSQVVSSFGFCFGGAQSMNLAVSEFAPDASIIFYGSPVTNVSQLRGVSQPVLGVFGGADQSIPLSSVQALDEGLDGVVDHEVIVYEGANHAFANPSGDRFDEEAAAAAWQETLAFLSAYGE